MDSKGAGAQGNAETPLPPVEGRCLEEIAAILNDEILQEGLPDDYVQEEAVAPDVVQDVAFVLDPAAVDLVEEAHHDERVEDDREELRLLQGVLHVESEQGLAEGQEPDQDSELQAAANQPRTRASSERGRTMPRSRTRHGGSCSRGGPGDGGPGRLPARQCASGPCL